MQQHTPIRVEVPHFQGDGAPNRPPEWPPSSNWDVDQATEGPWNLNAFLQLVPYGALLVDGQRRVSHHNPALERLAGISARDTIGNLCSDVLKVRAESGHFVCESLCPFRLPNRDQDPSQRVQGELITGTGRTVPVELTLQALRDMDGKIMGVSHMLREGAGKQEIDEIKDDFLALITHELRTPLTSISGYAQLLMRRLQDTPDGERYMAPLAALRRQTDHLGTIVDTLLDLSRIQSGRLELHMVPLDFARLVTGAVSAAKSDRKGRIRLECPASLPRIWADHVRIEQVVLNLLDNALKYSPQDEPIDVKVSSNGSVVLVSVRDYGPGMDEQSLKKLFHKFQRVPSFGRNPIPGRGLGLSLSKVLVEAHGGTIWAESTVGQGSTFYFTLPLSPAKPSGH